MATRKQRRRRAKEQRHDYEYVWEDSEGNVLDPDDVPDAAPADAKRAQAAPAQRQPEAPSLRRTLRRALIFAPVMLVVVMLLSDDLTTGEQIAQAALIVGIFIPFSYLLDSVFYRAFKRRPARSAGDGARGS